MQELKVIAKGAGFVFLGFFVSKLLSLFYRIVMARFLQPADFGIFSMGLAVVGIVTVFGAIGLYQGVLHFVAVFESQNKKAELRGTILGSLKLQFFASVLAGAALFLLAEPIALLVFKQPSLTLILQILAFTIPFQIITSNFMVVAQAFKKIEFKVLLRNIIENIAKFALTFLLLFLGLGAAGASLALAISSAFALIVSFYLIQSRVYRVFASNVKPVYNLRQLFGYSWPLFAVGFFLLIMTNVDTISLGILSTAHETGVYNVAAPTARVLELPGFLFALFLPVATGLYATKKMRELSRIFKTTTRWGFVFIFPCTLFAVIFSREILSIMFGSVYGEGAAALAILALGFFVFSLTDTARSMLEPLAKTKLILFNTVAAAGLNVALNFALIPSLGMVGAALATTISFFFLGMLALFEVFAAIKIHPFSRAFWKPAIASILTACVFFAAQQLFPRLDSFPSPLKVFLLVFAATAFLVIYALTLLAIKGLQREDIEIMKAIENRTGFRVKFARNIVKRFI